ncbi:hypothetical protein LXL04_000400 [Taraxacum kok-saghyz]
MEYSRRAATVGEPSLLDHRSSRASTQKETPQPQMEVNEPPIINVDEPPIVDVDDGDDEEVDDNKGGGHKVSWVWRHFDQFYWFLVCRGTGE